MKSGVKNIQAAAYNGLKWLNFLGGTTALVNLSTNSFCTMERTILHEIVHGLGGKVFEIHTAWMWS